MYRFLFIWSFYHQNSEKENTWFKYNLPFRIRVKNVFQIKNQISIFIPLGNLLNTKLDQQSNFQRPN